MSAPGPDYSGATTKARSRQLYRLRAGHWVLVALAGEVDTWCRLDEPPEELGRGTSRGRQVRLHVTTVAGEQVTVDAPRTVAGLSLTGRQAERFGLVVS